MVLQSCLLVHKFHPAIFLILKQVLVIFRNSQYLIQKLGKYTEKTVNKLRYEIDFSCFYVYVFYVIKKVMGLDT